MQQDKLRKGISDIIDRALEDENRKLKKECKILLLGNEGSGKSMIMKQMKVLHQVDYNHEELASIRLNIYRNLVDSAQRLILAKETMGLKHSTPENKDYANSILEYHVDADPYLRLTPDIVNALGSLYRDPITATCMERLSEFGIEDVAPYQVHRLGTDDYIPSTQDILRLNLKTTGISEIRFNMGQLSIRVCDIGQQRSERKKWIHCFEAVTSILFCVALSEYDQVLPEESGQHDDRSRPAESIKETILQQALKDSGIL
ncbi:Guanine nucleotide-binding protein alpha-2 subunit [Podila epicladia]|nr:Guanine nucleotide-binding protein alpha-2 subunit [Podila epicladia]